jgi:transcriptional regulator with XRE-family HTH domain
MTNVIEFGVGARPINKTNLREARKEFGLSLSQAAAALDTSPVMIENWERNSGMGPSIELIVDKFQSFIQKHGSEAGKNLIFGHYSLRMARELLGLSIQQVAEKYGYKPSVWPRLENNSRLLPEDKIKQIEEDVRSHFARICEPA